MRRLRALRIIADHITDHHNVVQVHLLHCSGLRCTSLYPLAAGIRLAEEFCIEQTRSTAGPNDQVPALRDVRYSAKRNPCSGRRVLFAELRAVREQGLTRTDSSGIKKYCIIPERVSVVLSEGE